MHKHIALLLAVFVLYSTNGIAQQIDSNYNDEDYYEIENYNEDENIQADTLVSWNAIEPKAWDNDSLISITSNKDYEYMQWIDSVLKSKNELASKAEKKEVKPPSNTVLNLFKLAKALVIIIVIAVLAFLLYKLAMSNTSLFSKRKKHTTPINNIHDDTDNSRPTDTELDRAIEQHEYRIATRIMYLIMLNHLQDAGYIKLAPQKTNYDYLLSITNLDMKAYFATCCRQYEYVWYGMFPLNEQQFKSIYNHYKKHISI